MENKAFLVAPSGFLFKNNLIMAKKRLGEMGFNKIYHRDDILSKYGDYAGRNLRRIEEINEAYDSSASTVFSVLGGMGSIQILQGIDYKKIKKSNKILVGFSDITLLLNSIYNLTGSRCIHGPNVGKNGEVSKKSMDCLKDVLNKKNYRVSYGKEKILIEGVSESKIVGGNLELLGRSLGTPFEINTKNKIVFLEDFKMKAWRVYDILWQLKLAGKFEDVKGIILGYFTDCGKNVDFYLKDFFEDFKCPVIINQPIGHEDPNLSIPLGEKCIIDTVNGFWGIRF